MTPGAELDARVRAEIADVSQRLSELSGMGRESIAEDIAYIVRMALDAYRLELKAAADAGYAQIADEFDEICPGDTAHGVELVTDIIEQHIGRERRRNP